MAEQIGRRNRGVEVRRIYVPGDRSEEINVVSPHNPDQRSGIAYLQFIEGLVPEN